MKRDFRDAVFAVVHELMRADSSIVVLTNDNGAWGLDTIREEFPARVVNVGVAEQNMMALAGGLASSGKRVFVYGQCAHLMRGWELIKVCICLPNLPVTILGLGGPSMWRDGPTHYGTEDLGLMRTLRNMTVCEPFEWGCVADCVKMAYEARTPHYIRFDKYAGEPLGGGIPFGG
jgi:transketolase